MNAKKGISARQLARYLKVNRNTAWRISMKIREAMFEPEQRGMLQGLVEMDEFSYRFNHRDNKDVFGLTLRKGLGVA